MIATMPVVSCEPCDDPTGQHHYWIWSIPDFNALAHCVALIALGQWRQVESILQLATPAAISAGYAKAGAVRMLTASDPLRPWHRDGWLFQCISWIAAVESGAGPARAPQMIHAQKGTDGLQLIIDAEQMVSGILILEDKATSDPRSKVRDEIWPSFLVFEAGTRDNELAGEVSALLDRHPTIDPIQTVDQIFREKRKLYRAATTVGEIEGSLEGVQRLYDGYIDVVPGERLRRQGHVLPLADLRSWLDQLASAAIAEIEGIDV